MGGIPENKSGVYTLRDLENAAYTKVGQPIIDSILDAQPLFDQATMTVCNDGTRHVWSLVTQYPDMAPRRFNEGIDAVRHASMQQFDSTAMYAAYSTVDANMFARNKNSATWRTEQDRAFARGFAHGMARRIFNASLKDNPAEFNGFKARITNSKATEEQYIDALDGAARTSGHEYTDIWLINWDPSMVTLIHPEGGVGGLKRIDRGEQEAYDKNNRRYRAHIVDYEWDLGLAIIDPRQVIRVANVDLTKLKKTPTAEDAPDLQTLLIRAQERLPELITGHCGYYIPRTIKEALRLQMLKTPQLTLQFAQLGGKQVETYSGIPLIKMPNDVIGVETAK